MKNAALALLLMFCLFAVAAHAGEMTGIITCEKCKHTDEKALTCARTCVKSGVPAGFVNSADGKYYKVANQEKVKAHVGHKVVVNGQVNGDTLTVDSLKMARKS
ncbi:MAG: hypothetical protein ACE15B_06145 [Bryobacteraceae bacterium]